MRPALSLATCLIAVIALPTAPPTALAQRPTRTEPLRPTPTLIAADGDGEPLPLSLTKMTVYGRVAGVAAQTDVTMTFSNPTGRALAADLSFPLPDGATVSAYALDIDGQLVDAVAVDRDEARRVFEAEVRKGVDPGLVEYTRGNVFKTRVFPVPAHGERTIRVTFASALDATPNGRRYRLPLKLTSPAELTVDLAVVGDPSTATRSHAKVKRFDGDLVLTTTPPAEATYLQRSDSGDTWFGATAHVPPSVDAPAPPIASLRVLWDASGSRTTADRTHELGLLRAFIAAHPSLRRVALIVFRDRAESPQTFALPDGQAALFTAIETAPLDGGTALTASLLDVGSPADITVVFSDGLHTFGERTDPAAGPPGALFTVSSSTTLDGAALRGWAARSGGVFINLDTVDDATALRILGRRPWQLISVKVVSGKVDQLTPSHPEAIVGLAIITGRLLSPRATLELAFGYAGRVIERRTVALTASAAPDTKVDTGEMLRRMAAGRLLRELMSDVDGNRDAIRALGRTHGLVTPFTSLLVLELLDQYVAHDIRPPAMLEGMRKQWDAAKTRQAGQQRRERQGKLKTVLALWRGYLAWYKKDFPKALPKPKLKKKRMRGAGGASSGAGRVSGAGESDTGGGSAIGSMIGAGVGAGGGGSGVERVLGMGDTAAPPQEAPSPTDKKSAGRHDQAAIALRPWTPDAPYMAAIKAASADKRYAAYLIQRAEFGDSVGFYLDAAELFRPDAPAIARRILSNIAELDLSAPGFLRVLAHRLSQWGDLDAAIAVFDEVKHMRPEEPQSFRDLALVLARRADNAAHRAKARADYERAMVLLAKVVMNDWDRFEEIELIALTELNRIWPRARQLGARKLPVDRRLIHALPMDVRVVMTWDADLTDMDLHVVEPTGEEASYSNNLTHIGGRVSKDFTQGYGPEVYAQRDAPKGEYAIKATFYGSAAVALTGPVTLQVEVFTNYGRRNEQRRAMTFRLEDKKEEFEIGVIEL